MKPLGAETMRFGRTVHCLRPAQILARGRLRSQRALLSRWSAPVERVMRRGVGGAVGWPAPFLPYDAQVPALWPSAEDLMLGRCTLLGQTRQLREPGDWSAVATPRLWRYHLHYWDWAWSLALHDDRERAREAFGRLYRSWRAGTRFGHWDEWSPYVAAVRAWAFCGLYAPLISETELSGEVT